MNIDTWNQLLRGGTATACLASAAFFVRFYRTSRDPLFLYFALALLVFAVNSALLAFHIGMPEGLLALYATRAAAFLLIVFGIVRKNRGR